jgi:hypothetical protein
MPGPCQDILDQIDQFQDEIDSLKHDVAGGNKALVAVIHGIESRQREAQGQLSQCVIKAIGDKYTQMGGKNGVLGKPVGSLDGDLGGTFQIYEHGGIFWRKDTGLHAVQGLIYKKWKATGRQHGPLGYPTSDQTTITGGHYSNFDHGTIDLKDGAGEAFEAHGPISARYIALEREHGILGFIETDQNTAPDGVGHFNHFDAGSIYWKPTVGAHEVHGAIRVLWAQSGWETSPQFGYPIANEHSPSNSDSRFSDFEDGVILWFAGLSTAGIGLPVQAMAPEDVAVLLSKQIHHAITHADSPHPLYITKEAVVTGITDYSIDPSTATVRGRMYMISVSFGVSVDGVNDPDVTLNMAIELRFDRPTMQIQAIPRNVSRRELSVELDWPTNWLTTPESVAEQIATTLASQFDVPTTVMTAPPGVIAVKVMRDGTVNPFLES